MKRNRLALAGALLAVTTAVGYAQLGSYRQPVQFGTPAGQSLIQALQAINSLYFSPVDQEKLFRGAIQGAISSLEDDFTYYLDKEESTYQDEQLAGEFFGIGVTLTPANPDGSGSKVAAVFQGGSAFASGVQAGDVFAKVGDTDVTELSQNKIVSLVRGAKGSRVTITFLREGRPYTVTLERKPVTLIDVETTTLPGNIGYIDLRSFGNTKVSEQFRAALADMKARKVTGLVLDLRDNPGGLLSAAIDITDQFLGSGPIVSERDASGKTTVLATATPQAGDYTGNMVVLVNKYTASASEILAGALQDAGRARVIGEKTFGKGVVGRPIDLPDGSTIVVTTSEWLTPKGRSLSKQGVQPDLVVPDNRFPPLLNFSGGGLTPGQEVTLTVEGKPVKVKADQEGKFSYTAPRPAPKFSDKQGVAVVDLQDDDILKRALAELNKAK